MMLENKNIVITGGTSGIGRELVRQLCTTNRVAVVAGNQARLESLSQEFPGVATIRADLARHAELENAANEARRLFDGIDLLINNAAIQHTPTFLDECFEPESIRREAAINFVAVCELTAALLPALLHSSESAIVNVNSGLALMPKTESAVYCATKAAVNAFSQSLRRQLEGTDVRVMQAFMPLVDTPMTAGRGTGKLSAERAARTMLQGIEAGIEDHDIGKVRLLRTLVRFAPSVARRVMRAA